MKKVKSYISEYTSKDRIKKLIVTGLTVLSAYMVKQVVYFVWKKSTDTEPPLNPASHKVSWQDAFLFTILTGVLASVTRLIVLRNVSLGLEEFDEDTSKSL